MIVRVSKLGIAIVDDCSGWSEGQQCFYRPRLLQFAATEKAEAGFFPMALVNRDEGSFLEIDQSLHPPIEQAAGVVKNSSKSTSAQQFVDFLLSEEGQRMLEAAGYLRVR